MKLSASSIRDARREISDEKQWLIDKNVEFVKRLAEFGIPVIEEKFANIQGDSDPEHYTHVEINSFQTYAKATLIVEGRDILFIEYGSGIHYNGSAGSSPHPEGVNKGYTIGSYGKGYGKYDHWYYYDATGAVRKSKGTKSAMPVYTAYLKIRDNVLQIAREVFNG